MTGFGMGLNKDDLMHVSVLSECSEVVGIMHLMLDHSVQATALAQEESTTMLHMHLHGTVIEIRDEEDG